MSYILLFLLFVSIRMISAEIPSEFDRLKEHLHSSCKELSMIELSEAPKAITYLNSMLTKNTPHQINLFEELTQIITEWSPDILLLDPTCPYYFSKFNNNSSTENDLNLLLYLQGIESNQTFSYPFINIFPQSYRHILPFLSIFNCQQLISQKSNSFFHNIEFLIGPGKTEFPLKQQSNQFSQFYCSLYGYPQFLLINQTTQTLFSQNNFTDIDFYLTNLSPGKCLFVPSDWILTGQLNNSISIVFTLQKIKKFFTNERLSCTKTDQLTYETIEFTIKDTFNMSKINLLIYFYDYLNPPMFDKEYTNELFLNYFREDKNISQLVLIWTSELSNLIKMKLFQEIDINSDQLFNIYDYINIKQLNIKQLEISLNEIFEEIHKNVLEQYNQFNKIMKKLLQQSPNDQLDKNDQEIIEIMLENLPDSIKDKFKQNNINIKDILNIIKNKKIQQNQSYRTDL